MGAQRTQPFRVGEWKVLPAKNLLESGMGTVRLGPTAMQVLVTLAMRPGGVVTREEILEDVWKGAFVVDEVLTNAVWELRRALGDDVKTPRYIQTIPKEGYRLVAEVELSTPRASTARSRPARAWIIAASALVGLSALGFFLWKPAPVDVRPEASSKPSIAVLYFDNVTGDPSLEWLHTGLTDMLVTDLSQSPRLDVLSTDRLYQILKESNRLDERTTSLDVVQEVRKSTGVEIVLLGSFMKAGDSVRINLRIQEAASGTILASEKVEGVGDDSLFPMVDDLTRRVLARLDVGLARSAAHPRLEDVTTSSVEAFRYYSAGMKLHSEQRERVSIPLFEKAIEIDPDFSMALARLAGIHSNLFHEREAFEYGSRALSGADRLPPKERAYIEGFFYTLREETYAKAIESYDGYLREAPDEDIRNNLGLTFWALELYDAAIENLEKNRGTEAQASYAVLSRAYAAQGRFEEGEQVLNDLLQREPDSAFGYGALGQLHLRAGELDEAREALERARVLGPGPGQDLSYSLIGALAEDWNEAERATTNPIRASDPVLQWRGWILTGARGLFHGQAHVALDALDAAFKAFPEPEKNVGASESYAAHVFLELGRYEEAQARAERAQRYGQGNHPEWEGLFYQALAEERLGRSQSADERVRTLENRTASIPGPKEKRRVLHLRGELALARGEIAEAIEELTRAESLLPPRGFSGSEGPPQHVPIWFSLASAHLASGNDEEAMHWFRRVAESTNEHLDWPILYVRSFYFLGKIHESRGEVAEAMTSYRRFVDFWGEGDIDRGRVAQAREKL